MPARSGRGNRRRVVALALGESFFLPSIPIPEWPRETYLSCGNKQNSEEGDASGGPRPSIKKHRAVKNVEGRSSADSWQEASTLSRRMPRSRPCSFAGRHKSCSIFLGSSASRLACNQSTECALKRPFLAFLATKNDGKTCKLFFPSSAARAFFFFLDADDP